MAVAFVAVAPFAGRPLATLNAFFPSLDAIVFVTDLITAVLLFAQFSISRSRSIFALASGYLFTALIVIPHALTFTGAFSETGLSVRSPNWVMAFYFLAFWVRRNLTCVRTAQGRKTCKVEVRGDDATCDWLERGDCARFGVRSYMARH